MKDSDRAARGFERNLERRVKNEGAAAGPVGQKIIRENIWRLANAIDGVGRPLGPIGRKIVDQNIRPLLDLIERVRVKRPTRENLLQNALNENVWDLIHEVETEVLVRACLAGVLNYGRVHLREGEKPSIARSMNLIGKEVQLHIEAWKLDNQGQPKLAANVVRAAAHKSKRADRWKEQKLLAGTKDWPRKDRIKVGAWASASCLEALPNVFEAGEFGPEVKEEQTSGLFHIPPVHVPSFDPPQPWTEFYNADGAPFLRHVEERLTADEMAAASGGNGQLRTHMAAVSYLQSIPCVLNEPVHKFVKGGWLVELKWRGDRTVFQADMCDAERVRGQTFYVDMSCDHRGRVNALPHFHFGRGDQIRSLFKFAHGAPIGERGIWWLKVATANCYDEDGMSRASFEERAAWTERNLERICKIAADPVSGVRLYGQGRCLSEKGDPWLAKAKDPHQFLAHAIELTGAIDVGPTFVTTLPIAFDASNSGAQHYAMLMRDRSLAELTNLIDGDEPRDLYGACGKRISDHFTARLDEIGPGSEIHPGSRRERDRIFWCMVQKVHERKAQKGFMIEWIYGSGQSGQSRSMGRRIRKKNPIFVFKPGDDEVDAFGELVSTTDVAQTWLPKADLPKETMKWFVKLQREAMEQTAPCIPQAMEFIKSLPMPLRWVSPSGVEVHNIEREVVKSVLSLYWKAEPKPTRNVSAIEYAAMDKGETRRAAPPNFIHSLDAAHLAFVALACQREGVPLLTVHDSFAALSCHADKLRDILMRELRNMYVKDDWLDKLGSGRPQAGDLRIEEVTGRYAFG